MPIPEYVERHGWPAFRAQELECLSQLIAGRDFDSNQIRESRVCIYFDFGGILSYIHENNTLISRSLDNRSTIDRSRIDRSRIDRSRIDRE